ncbi:MAG: PAS domain S-box protein, partial [Candidatus Competibacter sp.]|nr:PAS domain S-box protein [Candidatus Competibacter sp.]
MTRNALFPIPNFWVNARVPLAILLVLAVVIMGLGHAIQASRGQADPVVLTTVLLIAATGVGVVLWWCQRRIRVVTEGYRQELERRFGAIARDIAERKQAAAKLVEQKDLLETILQQAAEAIVMCDAQGNPLLVNAAARRLALGETRDQPDSGPTFLWGKAYYPDGHPVPLQAWPLQKALRGGTTVGAEARVVRPDGSTYDVLISAAPVRREGQGIVGAVAMFSDITERKR